MILKAPLRTLALALCALSAVACDAPPEQVTWHADVQPVVENHCTRCHYDGGQGVGDFTDREVVEAMSDVMLAEVDAGRMPPPASDPACRDYVGSERLTISQDARDTLATWIDQGKPEGDPADAPELERVSDQLEDPDLEVLLPEPYLPTWWDENNPGNEYRCFILDHGQEDGFWIQEMAPVIDNRDVVHHVLMFTMHENDVPDDYDPAQGYSCIQDGTPDDVENMVAGWAPGALPMRFPPGKGIWVPGNNKLVLQMHYFRSPDADPAPDRSGYAFNLADEVSQGLIMYPLGIFNFRIPAGAEAHTESTSFRIPDYLNLDVHSVNPHMHVLGSGYAGSVERADGSVECLAEGDFNFNNQLTYQYREPLRVYGGDRINFECTWNNSTSNPQLLHDPPIETRYGERTDEEMCFAFAMMSLAP